MEHHRPEEKPNSVLWDQTANLCSVNLSLGVQEQMLYMYSTGQRDGSITRAFHACKDAILHAISMQNTRRLHTQNTRVKKYTESASKIYTQSASKIS